MKLAVCGPPNSGKSTITAALIQYLRERTRYRGVNGTVGWVSLDPVDTTLAGLLDETPDERPDGIDGEAFTDSVAQTVRQRWSLRTASLVIGDAPGLVDNETETVVEPADAMLLVVSDQKQSKAPEWHDLCTEIDAELFGNLTTTLDTTIDPCWDDRQERTGRLRSVHNEAYLTEQAGAYDDRSRRMIKQLAGDLLDQTL